MSPLTRLILTVLVSMLAGAGIAVSVLKRMEPAVSSPDAQAPVRRETLVVYTPANPPDIPGWTQDSVTQALPAIRRSCARLAALAPESVVGRGIIARPAREWQAACRDVAQMEDSDAALRSTLARDFTFYRVGTSQREAGSQETGGAVNDRGTFTGYYEADLNGSFTRGGSYQVPIYARPRNMVTINIRDFLPPGAPVPASVPASLVGRLVPQSEGQAGGQVKPYFTRSEIDSAGAIAGDADVLIWADDPVAVHVLHIQGSGRVTLPDGQVVRIGFDGHNGRAFKGIGSILLEAGQVKPGGASMVDVREWLKLHPTEAAEYMNKNNRYIFFRRLSPTEAEDGPIGAMGVSLSALRSMAVDPRYIPLGAPVWLDTVDPDGLPLQRLMVAQDVGAAITGAVRGDIFWGAGDDAFSKAGRMKSSGTYYVFVPRARSPISDGAAQPEELEGIDVN